MFGDHSAVKEGASASGGVHVMDRGFTPPKPMTRPSDEGDLFRGPNRRIVHCNASTAAGTGQASTFAGIVIFSEAIETWAPQSVNVYNYTNQWVKIGGTDVFVPPYTMLGPIQLKPGHASMDIVLRLPDANYVANNVKSNQWVTAVFQEQAADGPTMAFAFTGP